MHGASAKYMKMQMSDGLTAVVAGISDEPETVVEILLPCHVGGSVQELAEQLGMIAGCVGERRDVLPGDNEQMNRRLRVHVGKGDYLIVFIDKFNGNGARGDFAEDAVWIGSGGHGLR